jgi:hypothetical protein
LVRSTDLDLLFGLEISPFDVTGKAMKGWVMVDGSRWEDEDELKKWLAIGREFALTLPAK